MSVIFLHTEVPGAGFRRAVCFCDRELHHISRQPGPWFSYLAEGTVGLRFLHFPFALKSHAQFVDLERGTDPP